MPRTVITRSPKHTPLCDSKCEIKHNDLVLSLYESNLGPPISKENRIGISCGHLNLKQCIEACVSQGWDRDSFVEDTSEVLQKPLIYLAACFGKGKSLDLLLKMGLSPSSRTKEGETALHGAVRYLYKCCGLCSSKVRKQYFLTLFMELNRSDPKLVLQKDHLQQQTALQAAAEMLTKDKLDHLCKLTYKSKRKRHLCKRSYRSKQQRDYYQMCLETMLNSMLASLQRGFVSYDEVMEAINSKDHEGNTVMNILARSPHEQGSAVFQYIMDKFLNIDKETMMSLSITPLDTQTPVPGDTQTPVPGDTQTPVPGVLPSPQTTLPDLQDLQNISASDDSEFDTSTENCTLPETNGTISKADRGSSGPVDQSMVVRVDSSALLINYPDSALPAGNDTTQVVDSHVTTADASVATSPTVCMPSRNRSSLTTPFKPQAQGSSKRKRSAIQNEFPIKRTPPMTILPTPPRHRMNKPNSVDVGAQVILSQNPSVSLPGVGVQRYATAIPVHVNELASPHPPPHSNHLPISYPTLQANSQVSLQANSVALSGFRPQESPSSTRKIVSRPSSFGQQDPSTQPVIIYVDSLTTNGGPRQMISHPVSFIKEEFHCSGLASSKVNQDCESANESAERSSSTSRSGTATPEQPTSTQAEAKSPMESSLLDMVVMEDSGLDAAGKSDVLNVFQLHYKRRLADLQSTLPPLDEELSQKKTELQKKRDKLDELECQMAFLRNQIGSLSSDVQEKEVKRNALFEEECKLRKRINICDETRKRIGGAES